MILAGRPAKILLIDTNVYFSKRLSDALKREGFEVVCSTQPAFALTTLEYDAPGAIVCSTNMREMGALDIARLVRADAKNAAMPIIALGDGSQRALMEAFQAGCDDYIDRTRPPAVIATHIRNIIISKAEGFQPTQMLPQSDTSLSGSLTHHDLPGVMQMLGHAHQTGALHINSGDTDALLFFDAGEIVHAECASLFGDEAVIHILKSCMKNNSGVYKFAYGSASTQRTVLRSATDLMLDAMREIDESAHHSQDLSSAPNSDFPSDPQPLLASADSPSPFTSLLGLADSPASDESSAITAAIDTFASTIHSPEPGPLPVLDSHDFSSGGTDFSVPSDIKAPFTEVTETQESARPDESPWTAAEIPQSETNFQFSEESLFSPEPGPLAEPADTSAQTAPADQSANAESSEPGAAADTQFASELSPFANYSLIPYTGIDTEDIT